MTDPYFLVFDAFSSDTQSRKASFMLHSPTPLQRGGTAVFSTEAPGLLVATPDAPSVRLGTGMAHLGGIPGRRPARQLIRWASLDMMTSGDGLVDDLAVLLYPFRNMPLPKVGIRRGESHGPGGTAYLIVEHGGGVDHIVISDGSFRTFGADDVGTDAICAVVRTGSRRRLSLARGRFGHEADVQGSKSQRVVPLSRKPPVSAMRNRNDDRLRVRRAWFERGGEVSFQSVPRHAGLTKVRGDRNLQCLAKSHFGYA